MKIIIPSQLHKIQVLHIIGTLLILVILVFISSIDELIQIFRTMSRLPNSFHTSFLLSSLYSNTITSFIPILSVIPFAGSYVDDMKSRFVRFFLIRTSYSSYFISQIGACFLCGGFVVFLGILLAWGVSSLLFLPLEMAMDIFTASNTTLTKNLALLFLSGGLWAVVGMTMSTLMESKYIAYASPFVIYYLLVILYERYFPDWFLICPREWVNPSGLWPLGFWGPAILIIELTALFSLIFVCRVGRRLREL